LESNSKIWIVSLYQLTIYFILSLCDSHSTLHHISPPFDVFLVVLEVGIGGTREGREVVIEDRVEQD
jgi:hypothetical protein